MRPSPSLHRAKTVLGAAVSSVALLAATTAPVQAQASPETAPQTETAQASGPETAQRSIDIPAGPLGRSIIALTEAYDISILAPNELVADKNAPAVSGTMNASEALRRMLAGSDLIARPMANGGVVIEARAGGSQDTAAPGRAGVVNEIIVTGTEYNSQVAAGQRLGVFGYRDRLETPVSVLSYTNELLENQIAVDLGDVLANDASVVFNAPPFASLSVITGRGLDIPPESFLFDGMSNQVSARSRSLVGVENVEVLRGPAALFTGASANIFSSGAGGTINLAPKRATDDPVTDVTLGYDSDTIFIARGDVGRRFGDNGAFGLRVGTEILNGDTPVRFGEMSQAAVSVAADYRGDRFRATADLFYQDTEALGNTREFFGTASVLPETPDGNFNSAQPWNEESYTFRSFLVGVEYDILAGTTVFARYGQSVEDAVGAANGPGNLQANGDFSEFFFGFTEKNERSNFEAGLRGTFHTGPITHNFVAVYNRATFDFSLGLDLPGAPAQPNNIFNFIEGPSPSTGPFPEDANPERQDRFPGLTLANTISAFDDTVLVTVGARYQSIESATFDGLTGAPTGEPVFDSDKWSPAVTAVYRVTDTVSLYGNYLQSLSTSGVAPITAENRGVSLEPRVSEQIEFGAKTKLGGVGAEIGFFQIDEPSFAVNPATNIFEELGNTRIRGVDVNLFGEIADGLRLLGGLTYLDTDITESADPTIVGNEITVPALRTVMNAEYDIPQISSLTVTGRFTFTGDSFQDTDNNFEVRSWVNIDVGARYAFNAGNTPFTARLFLRNAFNERYWVNGNGSIFLNAPRTVNVSISASL